VQVWTARGPPARCPSPKSHTVETRSPSGSEAAAVNRTGCGAVPEAPSAATRTVGGRLPFSGAVSLVSTVQSPSGGVWRTRFSTASLSAPLMESVPPRGG
jgi:hypothetical protein